MQVCAWTTARHIHSRWTTALDIFTAGGQLPRHIHSRIVSMAMNKPIVAAAYLYTAVEM